MNDDRVCIFSNGSQWTDWLDSNCDKCAKSGDYYAGGEIDCPILKALSFASCDDGRVSPEIAHRAGADILGAETSYGWPCREFENKETGEGWNIEAWIKSKEQADA